MTCECISCPDCTNGHVWVTLGGKMHKSRCDDMGDLETCLMCEGSGLREMCDECREAEEESEWPL